jgi:hypothetical protein
MTLYWLLRAWNEKDPIVRFLGLFLPIEMVLAGHTAPTREDQRLVSLRRLITENGGNHREDLLATLHELENRAPSLVTRFEAMAQELALPDWESDVEAFRRFNRMRARLLHRGLTSVEIEVEVADNDWRNLQDLSERYVAASLAEDARVYPSKWRRHRAATPTNSN